MPQWCPRCGSEYVEGWGTCSNCGIGLVDEPPSRQVDVPPTIEPSDPEEFVPIWEGPTPEAGRLSDAIRRAHIPVDLGEALQTGHARIEVPRSYVDEARAALAGTPTEPSLRTDFDWARLARIALVIVAVLLVALLVLPSL